MHADDREHSGHNQHAGHSIAMFRDKFWLSLAPALPVE
jgi:Cu2+-exporting ATPase